MSGFRPPEDKERCIATVTNGPNKGGRCPKYRVKGSTVCLAHGSLAPQVRAAAQRRVADQQAVEMAQRIQVDVPEFTSPGEAARFLLTAVTRRAMQFGALADQLGENMVYTDKAGVERLRAAIDGEREWLTVMGRVLGLAVAAQDNGDETRRQAEAQAREAIGRLGVTVLACARRAVRIAADGDTEAARRGLAELQTDLERLSAG